MGISTAPATAAQPVQTPAALADAELVRRVRAGDDGAFEQLYHRYHRRITAYIHGMVHDHGRAEDVAQDVFVSALRRIRATDRPIAFKPWVYEIAKNACIDQFRRSRRAEEVSYDADEGLGAADYGRLVSPEALPEAELESKTNLDHLRGAFGGLSETHHEILVLRELEGLSYREIGERLGMSRPSVESTLFRARRRLTEEYEELVSGARCQRIQAVIAGAVGRSIGARDQRRLARHVSHCQPCRRQARLAGLEIPAATTTVRERIAALLPLPLVLRRRWMGGDDGGAVAAALPHGSLAQWSAQLGSAVDPSWLKAAATAAAVAIAGAGAGLAARDGVALPGAGTISQAIASLSGDGDGDADGDAGASREASGGGAPARGLSRRSAAVAAGPADAGNGASAPGRSAPAGAEAAPPQPASTPSVPAAPSAPAPAGAAEPPQLAPAQPSRPALDGDDRHELDLASIPSGGAPSAAPDPAATVQAATTGVAGGAGDTATGAAESGGAALQSAGDAASGATKQAGVALGG